MPPSLPSTVMPMASNVMAAPRKPGVQSEATRPSSNLPPSIQMLWPLTPGRNQTLGQTCVTPTGTLNVNISRCQPSGAFDESEVEKAVPTGCG